MVEPATKQSKLGMYLSWTEKIKLSLTHIKIISCFLFLFLAHYLLKMLVQVDEMKHICLF